MGKSRKTEKLKKKHKHKERKEKKKSKRPEKRAKDKLHLQNKTSSEANKAEQQQKSEMDFAIPLDLMSNKSHAPETPEEYQKRQSRIRREVDPSTGRTRLVKGDGEVLEEIVSKDRHKAINKNATKGDGAYFEETSLGKIR